MVCSSVVCMESALVPFFQCLSRHPLNSFLPCHSHLFRDLLLDVTLWKDLATRILSDMTVGMFTFLMSVYDIVEIRKRAYSDVNEYIVCIRGTCHNYGLFIVERDKGWCVDFDNDGRKNKNDSDDDNDGKSDSAGIFPPFPSSVVFKAGRSRWW